MALLRLLFSFAAIALARPEGTSPKRMVWRAPEDHPHVRRLQSVSAQTYTVEVRVVKKDAWGPEPARVDVSFVPPGHSESNMVTVSFPGTDGNAGIKLPMGLQHGANVNITGYQETDATEANALKAAMLDQALASGMYAANVKPEETDKRGVFVATEMEYERDAGQLAGRRLDGRRLGNAAAQNTAVVVLYQPCGTQLSADVTKDRLQSAFFDSSAGSFNQVLGVCSRNTVSFTGAVVGPIDGCPDSQDVFTIYRAIDSQLQGTPEWDNNVFKVMVLPNSWISAAGIGTVGGSLTWYREQYVGDPLIYLHEIGHNWKLHHAGNEFSKWEYSDSSSAMGYCCRTVCYNFLHAWQLGFADYEQEFTLDDLLASPTSTDLTVKALGTEFNSGIQILTNAADGRGETMEPSFLVISWRAREGTDQYLQGSSHGNKVQVHHWDGDSRTDAQITYKLHEVDRGTTTLIQDTDRINTRIMTGLKMTVKGTKWDATSSTVEVLLCKKLDSEDENTASPEPCPEAGVTTTTSTTGPTTTTTTTTAILYGEMTLAGMDCSLLSTSTAINGLKAGLASTLVLDSADHITSLEVPCARRLTARSLQSSLDITYTITLPGDSQQTGPGVVSKFGSTSSAYLQSKLIEALQDAGVSGASDLVVSSKGEVAGETTTTTTTSFVFRGGSWGSYFSDEASSKDVEPVTALAGVGCAGTLCGQVRQSHKQDISLRSSAVTIHQLESDLGALVCQAGQIAMKLTCVGSSCAKLRLHCAMPSSGSISDEVVERDWFPSELHGTEDGGCNGDGVVVGIQCGGASCSKKKLSCAKYTPGDCNPACGVLGLECGDDGCGGTCGTCSAAGGEGAPAPVCRGDIGRCIYFVTTEWAQSGTNMAKTNLVSTGMGCTGRYCESVNLIQMSAYVDSANAEKSGWISDNTGSRWAWNRGTQAEDQVSECPDGMAVSYAECDGKFCDNIRFHCAKPLQWVVDMTEDPVVTDWFSEEEKRMDCPAGKVVTGVECQALKKWCISGCGDYCDNKRLRCRSIRPEMAGAAVLGILSAAAMPSSSHPAPPADSPWWDGATNTISDAWDWLSSGDSSVSGADGLTVRLGACVLLASALLQMR